jgi:hypothetical protein
MRRHRVASDNRDCVDDSLLYQKRPQHHTFDLDKVKQQHQQHQQPIVLTRTKLFLFVSFGLSFLLVVHLHLFRIVHGQDGTRHVQTSNDRPDLKNATSSGGLRKSTDSSSSIQLTPLRPVDREQYTIRMNTWRRNEQLVASVLHHSSCPGVAQVQIVWCDNENEPPKELTDPDENPFASKVLIERHEANSLNERFNILTETPTMGILSIDDDVIRPCEAIDSGFFKWTHNPHRMVGFDARDHIENDTTATWEYGYLSTTKEQNKYSLSLTRYCFLHRDYMDHYMTKLPKTILRTVAENLNCEDIAMSFMVSSLTGGQPSLLADLWAINSQIKLHVDKKISGGHGHKVFRDKCVDTFAQILGLKDENGPNRLKLGKFVHQTNSYFECGADPDNQQDNSYTKSQRELDHEKMVKRWRKMDHAGAAKQVLKLKQKAAYHAYEEDLLG